MKKGSVSDPCQLPRPGPNSMNSLQACILKLKVKFNPLILILKVDNYWTSVSGLDLTTLVTASEVFTSSKTVPRINSRAKAKYVAGRLRSRSDHFRLLLLIDDVTILSPEMRVTSQCVHNPRPLTCQASRQSCF